MILSFERFVSMEMKSISVFLIDRMLYVRLHSEAFLPEMLSKLLKAEFVIDLAAPPAAFDRFPTLHV